MRPTSFRARIFVQGVGVYVPEVDPKTGKPGRLQVLFPDSSQPHLAKKLRDGHGNLFPAHRAVVQYSARNLNPKAKDKWKPVPLAGYRLRVDSDSKVPLRFAGKGRGKGQRPHLLGLPVLADYLAAASLKGVSPVDPKRVAKATAATLEIGAGVVGPDLEFLGTWEWVDKRRKPWVVNTVEYTSVMRVELGMVTRLALVMEPLNGSPARPPIDLTPAAGFCDVWVRHDCDPSGKNCNFVERPGLQPDVVEAGDVDLDFTLNFAFTSHPTRVLGATGLTPRQPQLPAVRMHKSWRDGSPIGGWPQKCMGGQA